MTHLTLKGGSVIIDVDRAKSVAQKLHNSFSTTGIHGKNQMPEDLIPNSVESGSLDHVLFITMTVSIDYQREANALWAASRKSFEDPKTRYLYDPASLHMTHLKKIIADMQVHGLSKKPTKDAIIWRTVGVTFYKKWKGDPRLFLEDCGWESPTILKRIKADTHIYDRRQVPDYPYLRGDKISPLWLRMLRDNAGITKLKNMNKIPIPVDIHIARATLITGVVRGSYKGSLHELFEAIREAWFRGVEGLTVKNRPMIALDVDEPLWHLSKYGCSKRDDNNGNCPLFKRCEARELCVSGRMKIKKGRVEVDTGELNKSPMTIQSVSALKSVTRTDSTINHGNMPNKGDLFKGEISDLVQYDDEGWRRRDIKFCKNELKSKKIYGYPKRGNLIILVDTKGNHYECKFSKPEDEKTICLGTPGKLKKWYQRKEFSDEYVATIKRDGHKNKVYFEYTGDNNKFIIFTEKEFKSKHPSA